MQGGKRPVVDWKEMAGAAALLLLAGALLPQTWQFSVPSARAFPRALLLGIAACAVWIALTNGRKEVAPARGDEGLPIVEAEAFALAAAYAAAMPALGFLVATILYMAAGLLLAGYRRWSGIAVLSVVAPVLVFAVFRTIMYTAFPSGPLDVWLTERLDRIF